MILEANAYGLSFSVILSMTYGELKRYILFHRDLERRQYQNLSQIAYIQAGVIAAAVAGEDVGAVYDLSLIGQGMMCWIFKRPKQWLTLISFND